ncbi:hypothetical protein WMF30_09010 [Sorangium sp. So ce134]
MKQGCATGRSAPPSRALQRGRIGRSRGAGSVLGLGALALLGCTSGGPGGPEEDGAGGAAGGAPEAASAGTGAGTERTLCEERLSQDDCEAQPSGNEGHTCSWEPVSVSSEGAPCEALTEEHRCLTVPPGGPGGCAASVECGLEDGLHLLYRRVGGTVELHRFDGVCGFIPVGWAYCDWGADGTLEEGPSSCACACP